MEKLPVWCAVIHPPSLPMYGGYQTAEWFLRRQGRAPSQDETAAKGPGPKLFSHFEWRLSLPFPSHRVEYRILEFRKSAHTRTQSADRNPRTHQNIPTTTPRTRERMYPMSKTALILRSYFGRFVVRVGGTGKRKKGT